MAGVDQRGNHAGLVKGLHWALAGRMAIEMAHEIRNPLTVIKGYLQLQEKKSTCYMGESLGIIFQELHKLSRQIANDYTAVAIEDLNMRGMAQSLNLAKSTNDNGFGMLKTFLAYKLTEQGKQSVVIDKWFPSSKMCRFCKHENKELTLADRTWTCSHCGAELDRDINAAINIKNEGCRMLGIA